MQPLTTNRETPREPEHLRKRMGLWRKGLAGLPKEYITYHQDLAVTELAALEKRFGLTVLRSSLVDDGWLDGMRSVEAVVETPRGNLAKLKWNDTNRGFMLRCPSGGWATFSEEDLA